MVDNGINDEFEKVEDISAFASGEATINTSLREIKIYWKKEANFTVMSYRDSKDYSIIGEIEDTIALLEDN